MEEPEGEGRERPPSPPGPAGPAASHCGPAHGARLPFGPVPARPNPAVPASAPPPRNPFGISVPASATPSSLQPLCSRFCASPYPLPPLSSALRPCWTLRCSGDPPPQ